METVEKGGRGGRLTVADYLLDEEMDEDAEGLVTFQCMTPGEIVSKWVGKLRRRKDVTMKKQRCDESGNGNMQAKCLTICSNEDAFSSTSLGAVQENKTLAESGNVVSGQDERITSFKLGAGLGLALVVAASKNELTKMMELRKQMETIVENAKEKLWRKAADTCENQSYRIINNEESINSNGCVFDPICTVSQSPPYLEIYDKQSLFDLDEKELSMVQSKKDIYNLNRLDHLESEFEAELQLLNELPLDSDNASIDEVSVQPSSDSGCETVGYDEEETKQGNDPIDAFAEAHDGSFPPQELERRLHELLQAQQKEHIKKLEAALRSAKLKLRKNEVQVSWWRDTAHHLSQHFSKTAPERSVVP